MDARKLDMILLSCTVPAMLKLAYVSGCHGFFLSQPRRCRNQIIGSKKETSLAKADDTSLYCGV